MLGPKGDVMRTRNLSAVLATLIVNAVLVTACSGNNPTAPTAVSPTAPEAPAAAPPQTPQTAPPPMPQPVPPSPAAPRFAAQQQSDMIEAYLLKSGPMADTSAIPTCEKDRLWGWSEDVRDVEIVFSPRLTAEQRKGILQPAAQFTEITGGNIRFRERTAELPAYPTYSAVTQRPQIGQILVQVIDDIRTFCSGASACSGHQQLVGPNRMGSAYIAVGPEAWGATHEMGHMLLRACHVAPGSPVSQNSVMGALGYMTRFTDWEFDAMKEVYARGLRPGATRSDFVRVGLIN
jgi:hypothetical protein